FMEVVYPPQASLPSFWTSTEAVTCGSVFKGEAGQEFFYCGGELHKASQARLGPSSQLKKGDFAL
ncbi:hypothetical protein CEXT_331581, partial [Caerostris extrusa]